MRLLAIGIDKSVADPASASAKRQAGYYVGWDVDILILAVGEQKSVELNPGLRVYVSGGANKIQALLNGRRLMRKLAKKRYDVVTGQDFLWSGMLAQSAARRLGCGLHLQDHSGFFARPRTGLWERLLFPMSKMWAREADRIRTVSLRGKAGLERIGIGCDKIDVIPIATDVSRFAETAPATGKANVVCVARLEKEKGIDVLLESWGEVIKLVPEAKLRIVGDGSLRKDLEQQTVDAGIKGSVEFVGKQSDIREYLEWADIAVQPSWFEGWGLSVVEAAAAGRSVVMTDVGCAGEIIKDGESGLVVPVGDSRQLAMAMIRLLRDGELRKKLGSRAKELASALPDPGMAIRANRASLEASAKGNSGIRQKTLICAQAVDESDPLFGFFVPWLRKFAEHGDAIVCALRVSDPLPELPSGIVVRLMRKAGSRSKIGVILNVAKTSWAERSDYQSVFIRGDAQYLACLGWLWRLMGKKVVFWYTHYSAKNPWFWLAVPWANDVVTAVPESNPLKSALLIGHHLDTEVFKTRESIRSARPRILLFGRVSPVKRVAWMVKLLAPFVESGRIELTVIGKATDAASGEELKSVLPKQAKWEERDVPSQEAPSIYRDFDIFINATPGSMDKTILEAAASGLTVLAATRGLLRGLPDNLHWLRFDDERSLADSLEKVVSLSSEESGVIGSRLRDWVIRQHSVEAHLLKLSALLHELRPRRPMKQALKVWMHKLGLRNFGGGLPVVMFHSFDGQGAACWDRDRLISWLVRAGSAGYAFDNLKEAQSHVAEKNPNHGTILVTVDDATTDLLDVLVAFRMVRIKPLVFVPTRTREIVTSDGFTREVISSEKISELVREGSIDAGAHGQTHINLTGLEPDVLGQEIKGSYADIREMQPGQTPLVFAYPRGKSNRKIRDAVKAAGFTQAFTVEPGTWTAEIDPYAIPRITVMGWMSSKDLMMLIRSS